MDRQLIIVGGAMATAVVTSAAVFAMAFGTSDPAPEGVGDLVIPMESVADTTPLPEPIVETIVVDLPPEGGTTGGQLGATGTAEVPVPASDTGAAYEGEYDDAYEDDDAYEHEGEHEASTSPRTTSSTRAARTMTRRKRHPARTARFVVASGSTAATLGIAAALGATASAAASDTTATASAQALTEPAPVLTPDPAPAPPAPRRHIVIIRRLPAGGTVAVPQAPTAGSSASAPAPAPRPVAPQPQPRRHARSGGS